MNKPWKNPVPLLLVASDDSMSFHDMQPNETPLPLPPHPGAYGVVRKNHVHEGIDFYCPEDTAIVAVEEGTVVAIIDFTGPSAGSPWWHDTKAVLIEGESGVVAYGEITPSVKVGGRIDAGQIVGHVVQVLREDKGRPMSMLHLELHIKGTRDCYEWKLGEAPPLTLRDPTPYLHHLAQESSRPSSRKKRSLSPKPGN